MKSTLENKTKKRTTGWIVITFAALALLVSGCSPEAGTPLAEATAPVETNKKASGGTLSVDGGAVAGDLASSNGLYNFAAQAKAGYLITVSPLAGDPTVKTCGDMVCATEIAQSATDAKETITLIADVSQPYFIQINGTEDVRYTVRVDSMALEVQQETQTISTGDGTVQGVTTTDEPWQSYQIETVGDVIYYATVTPTSGDQELYICYNPECSEIVSWSGIAGENNIAFWGTENGVYYITVVGDGVSGYELTVTSTPDDGALPTAVEFVRHTRDFLALTVNGDLSTGTVSEKGSIYYQFSAEAGRSYTIDLAPTSGDTDLFLCADELCMDTLAFSASTEGNDRVTFSAEKTGLYTVEVFGYTDAEFAIAVSEVGNTLTTDGTPVNHQLAAGALVHYSFSAQEDTRYQIDLIASEGTAKLAICEDENCREDEYKDNSEGFDLGHIFKADDTQVYHLWVAGKADTTYQLSIQALEPEEEFRDEKHHGHDNDNHEHKHKKKHKGKHHDHDETTVIDGGALTLNAPAVTLTAGKEETEVRYTLPVEAGSFYTVVLTTDAGKAELAVCGDSDCTYSVQSAEAKGGHKKHRDGKHHGDDDHGKGHKHHGDHKHEKKNRVEIQFFARTTGDYTVIVEAEDEVSFSLSAVSLGGALEIGGEPTVGHLAAFGKASYRLSALAGHQYQVDLTTESQAKTLLICGDAQCGQVVGMATGDDQFPLTFTAPADGVFYLVIDSKNGGAFTIGATEL